MDKLEEVISLCQDEQIVNFVDEIVADVDGMKADDNPAEDVAEVSEPSGHEILMRFIQLDSVLSVETSTATECLIAR